MDNKQKLRQLYEKVLIDYVEGQTEQGLHKAQLLSNVALHKNISPEELSIWQKDILVELYPDLPLEITNALDFFVKMMKGYEVAFREMEKLRHFHQELVSEMEVAANVQSSLLGLSIPEVDRLEIGAVSIPARRVNGDYFHFVPYENGGLGVGLADVMGKGLSAALCMSMIKYAIDDHLAKHDSIPSRLLEALNATVEENMDDSMFVSMIYGLFDPKSNCFLYSSAGHEPAIYYNANDESFEVLYTKGLLLGVNEQTKYPLYEKKIDIGDMLIFVSDGVTESRIDGEFIDKEFLINEFRKNIHLHPREIVMKVYKHLLKLQHYKLRDDFTIIIIKRTR